MGAPRRLTADSTESQQLLGRAARAIALSRIELSNVPGWRKQFNACPLTTKLDRLPQNMDCCAES